jgi:hypothetical protein
VGGGGGEGVTKKYPKIKVKSNSERFSYIARLFTPVQTVGEWNEHM